MIKDIPINKLIVRDSKMISFRNSDIWVEELDALAFHTQLVSEKFIKDMGMIKRSSTPSCLAFALYGTHIDEQLATLIADQLYDAGNNVRKVVFVGMEYLYKHLLKKKIKQSGSLYVYCFYSDFEKAKEWLVPR